MFGGKTKIVNELVIVKDMIKIISGMLWKKILIP